MTELKNRLIEQGFIIQGAGALIGEHTYTHKLGTLRPRGEDIVEVRDFIYSILQEDFKTASIEVPGNNSYRPYKTKEVVPYCLEHCIKCGKCIRICPIQAISKDYVTDANCLVCNKCVKECPMNARILPSDFEENIRTRLESQFVIEKKINFLDKIVINTKGQIVVLTHLTFLFLRLNKLYYVKKNLIFMFT